MTYSPPSSSPLPLTQRSVGQFMARSSTSSGVITMGKPDAAQESGHHISSNLLRQQQLDDNMLGHHSQQRRPSRTSQFLRQSDIRPTSLNDHMVYGSMLTIPEKDSDSSGKSSQAVSYRQISIGTLVPNAELVLPSIGLGEKGEKGLYQCDECPRQFQYLQTLTAHKQMHMEENGDLTVAVVESGQTNAEGEEESILPFEIARYPIYSTFTSSDGYTVQAQATPVPAKNRVLLLRRKTTEFKTFSGPLNVVPVFGGRLALTATSTPTSMGILRTTTTSNKRKSPAVTRNIDLNEAKEVVSLPDDTWHKCTMCEKKYKCRSSLDSHIKIHQGEIAKCEFCGQTMSRTRDLKRHVATVHRDLLKSEDMPKVEVLLSTPDFPDPLSECEMKL
ncbi:unnamed protein product [Allacma fusca]|uniref:C2H2-type domain-containing protein n=1 Tax=Allacma fusca TaxID=39272 RepID=A0A8J2L3J2_9HEXA|nr:unnamed protein product [Allacma fusca]